MLTKLLVSFALLVLPCVASGQQPIRVAVLSFGNSEFAHSTAETLSARLKLSDFFIVDSDLARVAARGNGYQGSLNMTRPEARDLGAALGCEFYLIGDAQVVRRSPSNGSIYFEAYASLFVVSARTGNLINWSRPSFQRPSAPAAERLLVAEVTELDFVQRLALAIRRAQEDESERRTLPVQTETVIEEAPTDEKDSAASGIRAPRPFRRIKPIYTDEAARADAEATVDVLVDIDEKGEVRHAEVERWAGFGLDQASLDVVRQLHFFPAMRNGNPIPMRVLLRYNFRKPAKTT
jgi:TonB family protein